jgi:hydroxymethylbilane synthase
MTRKSARSALIIGSRGSKLALAQSTWVRQEIMRRSPGSTVEIRIIKTAADKDQKSSIRSGSGTGVFVKELEDALISGNIDLAVHSMKDVPTRIPDGLEIAAIPPREDPRDAMISLSRLSSSRDLPQQAIIGTGSIRRQAQLLALRPDLVVKDIRGNVDTRLGKLDAGSYDAVVLACAGLNRLGMRDKISLIFDTRDLLPAPGQGALALEVRHDDRRAMEMITDLNHRETAIAVLAEREFLRAMGGGCNSPVAVHARIEGGMLQIEGLAASPDGKRVVRESASTALENGGPAASALAENILLKGGREILDTCR